MSGRERRLFPRRELNEEFYCYAVDGARLDATSLDISAGGIFLQTRDDIPVGAPVALVFKANGDRTAPIYLTGDVVRRVQSDPPGIGVQWVKAVSNGPQEELRGFLEEKLTIRSPRVTAEAIPGQEHPRQEFSFPRVVASHADELADLNAMEEEDTADISADLRARREARLKVADAVKMDLPTGQPKYARSPEDGALTREITKEELRYPADLSCHLEAGGKQYRAHIVYLGTHGLFVKTAFAPSERADKARVAFELRVRGGMAKVTCRCDVLAIDNGRATGTPGFDLRIVKRDEGSHPGLLDQYVRWLAMRSMHRS